MTTTKLCVSVVCIDMPQKKVLYVFEKQNGQDVVNVPSGHVNTGEDPYQAAHRELKEETTVIADKYFFAGTTSLVKGDVQYFTMVYACHKPNDSQIGDIENIQDEDVYAAKWLTFEQFKSIDTVSHRNGFIEEKVRMSVCALMAIDNPTEHQHTPYHRAIIL